MDSPSEFGAFDLRTFVVPDGARKPEFRVAVHHRGDGSELDGFVRDVEKMVREARNVFGEFAPFDGNTYTFIADYLPWADGDAMEHRNSTIVTSGSSIRASRIDLLDTMAHEFFHSWNVERIRPASLEPFNFEDANVSGELWFAEGFTNYYGPLITTRAGLTNVREFAQEMGRAVNDVLTGPGRQVRTAEQVSQHAPFTDAAAAIDRTNFENTFISYYTWGEAIGLGLDLALRDRSNGRVTLDTLHARAVAGARKAWRESAWLRGQALHDGRSEARAHGGVGRCRLRQQFLFALHPGPRSRGLPDALRRAPAWCCGRCPEAAPSSAACAWRMHPTACGLAPWYPPDRPPSTPASSATT